MSEIIEPGIYDIPMAEYLADPCSESSITGSAVKTLLQESPLHCWHNHPRLGGGHRATTDAMDKGSIVHDLVFDEGGSEYVTIDVPDYRTKAAQEARDAARAAGKIPVIAAKMAELQDCAATIRHQIADIPDVARAMKRGQAESTMVWQEDSVWCRARPDWLPDDPALPMLNLKTTGMSASPEARERDMQTSHALSAAFYENGAERLRGKRPAPTLFIVAEIEAPFGMSILSSGPDLDAMAREDVAWAVRQWGALLAQYGAATRWPGYSLATHWIDAPAWMVMRREEAKMRRTQDNDVGERYQRLMEASGGGPIR